MLRRSAACLVLAAAVLAGCSSYYAHFEQSAQREIDEILSSRRPEAVERWQSSARLPGPEKAPAPAPAGEKPRVTSLREAVRVAADNNRAFKTEREALQLAALSLSLQRRNFGPILTNTISYVYANGASTAATGTSAAALGLSKIVPTGGTVTTTASGSTASPYEGGGPTTRTTTLSVSFDQPLLKGGGYEAAYEGLTQAEREVVYALRDFELYRQDFAIGVVRRYYAILRQKRVVENSRLNLAQYTFLRKRSDALFDIGRVTAIDKFRAAQEELVASNELLAEQEALAALLDDFKVFLSLPPSSLIDVEDLTPGVKPANIDLASAIEAALYNRLDLRTAAERLEDAERKVRVARNALLPELDLTASASLIGTKTGGATSSDDSTHSVGLSLSLPLDKTADRNAYKSAVIERQRRQRANELAADNVKVEVMNTYRRLRRLANSVQIETANVKLADSRFENAKLRFEAGELGNRDVVEAQAARLRAQNSLIGAILDYEVARLQLKRDIGIFFLDPDGTWKE